MRLEQKQKAIPILVKVGVAISAVAIIVFSTFFISNLFNAKDSKAIPANAATFSETCFSVADGGSALFEFNKYTGGPSSPGNTGIGSPEASTLNLIGDTLFVIDGNAGEFGYVNLSNATYTLLNSDYTSTVLNGVDGQVTFSDIDAMTVDNNDVFWVAHRDNNDTDPSYIAKMNHNGEFILNAFGIGVDYIKFQGPTGFPSVLDAMAYDPIYEKLYVCANDGSGNPTYNNLMQVNTQTGQGTFVGNFNVGDIEGLGFDGEGNMYATTGTSSNSSVNRNSFFSVNKYTAFATRVFTFSSGTDFETCDCIIGYKNTIKGTVYYDADGNGFIGSGESGYEGVTVNLYYDENNNGVYDAGTDDFVRSAVTDELGRYILYDAYETGTLNYVVTINTSNLPNGSSLTTDNIETASFSSEGNTDYNNDFGFNMPAASLNTITGVVYADDNQNATLNSGEQGVEDVTVYLYQDVNQNGVYDSGTDLILTSAQTEADGTYIFTRPFVGGTVLESSQVSLSNGDAEQDGTAMNLVSSDLDLGDKAAGMHFNNLNIPQGAVIESAYLELTSRSTGTSATTITITAEDVDNANTFGSGSNDITNRTQTSASQTWIMPYWNAVDVAYQSPDISDIVQEIVNRNGWASGNSLNLLTDQTSGRRSAQTQDFNGATAPKLVVVYSDPTVTDNYLTFIDESTLPTASVLTTDNIETATFSSGGNTDPNNNFGIYQDQSAFNTITGTVFRDNNEDATLNSGDVGENSITVCLFDDANGNEQYDSDIDVLLQVKKTETDGTYSFEQPYTGGEVLDAIRITQSQDDADDSPVTITSTDMDIAESDVALRFQNVNVPKGATITTAYISFTAEENATGSYSTNIEGIDVNNAGSFSASQNLSRLNRTTADVTWSASDAWSIGQPKTTPSLVSIAQEIVDRGGWSSGNSMGFILNEGTGKRAAESYNGNPNAAPQLVIGYAVATENYVVIIKESNLPNGYQLTTDNLETATFDTGGNTDPDNDFGYKLNTSGLNIISGTVFNDNDRDGTKGGGESGISSSQIQLYSDLNCNGVIDPGEPQIANTTTNASGDYSFNLAFNKSVEYRVSQSRDDVDENPIETNDIDLDFAQSVVGVRFNNINIQQGATIANAYIEFTSEFTKTGTYSFSVEGVDADNIGIFSTGQNMGALSRTSASAIMSGNETWQVGNKYNSPALTSIVQEIVDRSGWNANNSMAFVFNTGTGDRDAESFDGSQGNAPKLVIEFAPTNTCYVIKYPTEDIAQNENLTTSATQTASFTSTGNTDANNDFGLFVDALPVDLLSFTGNWAGNAISLDWTTGTEINNDYFDVQWSPDGVNFESIGTVKGYGNTLEEVNYNYIHSNPGSTNYYRLKQNDFDGAFEYSPVIIVKGEISTQIEVSASPNPFVNEFSLIIESSINDEAKIEIATINGISVYSQSHNLFAGSQSIKIQQAAQFNNGAYIVIIKTSQKTQTLKIIKQ